MRRRRNIKPDDVVMLLGEGRFVRQLEATPAMRSRTMCLPDRLDCRDGKPDRRGHRACCQADRFVRRRTLREADDVCAALGRDLCPTGRTRLVAQEAIDTFVHDVFLQAPHTCLRFARRRYDGRGPKGVAAVQNDTGSPNMLLRAQRRHHNAAQAIAVGFG